MRVDARAGGPRWVPARWRSGYGHAYPLRYSEGQGRLGTDRASDCTAPR
jgi:hypothetical protein